MIKTENLTKSFGDKESIEGHNGRSPNLAKWSSLSAHPDLGKSTVLRCLNLLEEPTSGEVILERRSSIKKETNIDAIRTKMGMVFQSFNLFPHLTVLENITIGPTR